MHSDIYSLYNINIINLDNLVNDKIYIEISNFLYEHNLLQLCNTTRDYKKIVNHFVMKNLLDVMHDTYNNIFLYSKTILFYEYILKISKLLHLNFVEIPELPILVDKNLIYQLKCLAENKKPINFKKVEEFCKKNSLTQITDKIKNNHKTKLILHK
jgi:hypothetical protein